MLKFFSKGSSAKEQDDKHTRELLEQECWSPPPFGTHEIRVLMCQEVNGIQDVVLFDSQQVHDSNGSSGSLPPESPSPSPARSSFRSGSMSSLFGSMRSERSLPSTMSGSQSVSIRRPAKIIPSIIPKLMFGTTPLAYKGSSTKIHLLSEPPQIMLTKTFSIHPTDIASFNSASTRRGSFSSSISSSTADMSGLSTVSGNYGDFRAHPPRTSRPMTAFIPDSAYRQDDSSSFSRSGTSAAAASTVSSSMPNTSSMTRSRAPRPGFDVRRLRRASQTSMENGTFNPTPLPSSISQTDNGHAKPALSQAARSKFYSIAVFIDVRDNVRLREFIFSHFALIESRLHHLQALYQELLLPVCRNRIMMAKGGSVGSGHVRSIPDLPRLIFQQETRILEAVARFQQSIYELYSAPRIQSPLWLNINTYPSKRAVYSASFISELTHLMEESPSSSQLVSEVISAVLRHHVSWVPTVAPSEEPSARIRAQGGYDPLWAQLSDLYGNIGTTSRISRTIVVGSNGSYVRRLLFILSYFIRCNEVFQSVTEVKEDPDSLLNPPKLSRMQYDIQEDYESGSPATNVRSINIPKRPRIDTFASSSVRGSSSINRASVSSRLTAIGEPTTPILPHHSDRPITPSVPRRPLFDSSRPRVESRDSLSTESTPYPSRPTSPMTIDSRPDSDRASAQGDENGSHSQLQPLSQQQQPQQPSSNNAQHTSGGTSSHLTASHQSLRVDTMRSRTQSSDTLATENSQLNSKSGRTDADSECGTAAQEVLADVPIPVSHIAYTFPPIPSPASYTTSTQTASMFCPSVSSLSSTPQPSLQAPSIQNPVNRGAGPNGAAATTTTTTTTNTAVSGSLTAAAAEAGLKLGTGPPKGMAVPDKILPADVLFCKSYGRSLMAPYCDHYMSDFALMGVPRFDFLDFMETDMKETMRHFEVQDKIQSTVCVVADANTMKCNVFCAKAAINPGSAAGFLPSSAPSLSPRSGAGCLGGNVGPALGGMSGFQFIGNNSSDADPGGSVGVGGGGYGDLINRAEQVVRIPNTASAFMDVTLHQTIDLSRNGLAAEMCLNYLEDRLYQLYQYSRMLASLTRDSEVLRANPNLEAMATLLGLHSSDMPLVLAVASTYDDLVVSVFE